MKCLKIKIMEKCKEIKSRWKTETPIFFKKIRNCAIKLGSASVTLLILDKFIDLSTYGIPQLVFQIATYIIVVCATMGLTAQITQVDAVADKEKLGKILKK